MTERFTSRFECYYLHGSNKVIAYTRKKLTKINSLSLSRAAKYIEYIIRVTNQLLYASLSLPVLLDTEEARDIPAAYVSPLRSAIFFALRGKVL